MKWLLDNNSYHLDSDCQKPGCCGREPLSGVAPGPSGLHTARQVLSQDFSSMSVTAFCVPGGLTGSTLGIIGIKQFPSRRHSGQQNSPFSGLTETA